MQFDQHAAVLGGERSAPGDPAAHERTAPGLHPNRVLDRHARDSGAGRANSGLREHPLNSSSGINRADPGDFWVALQKLGWGAKCGSRWRSLTELSIGGPGPFWRCRRNRLGMGLPANLERLLRPFEISDQRLLLLLLITFLCIEKCGRHQT